MCRIRSILWTIPLSIWMSNAAWAGPDACAGVGVVTCQGNQSGGVLSGTDFVAGTTTTLNVNSLTQDIAPPGVTSGIVFNRGGAPDITANIMTDAFQITSGGDGVFVRQNGTGAVTINHTGNVVAGGDGIEIISDESDVSVTVDGDLTAGRRGIRADAGSGTDDSSLVISSGTIQSSFEGIFARGGNTVDVTHTGNITSTNRDGIDAVSTSDDATVTMTGNIQALGRGIIADAGNAAADVATINSNGTIASGSDSLFARSQGDIFITHTGNISSTNADGVDAVSTVEDVVVTFAGDISAGLRGIVSDAGGGTTDSSTVTSVGNIVSTNEGILARGGDVVQVTHTGDITSTDREGIDAVSSSNNATVTNTGEIQAGGRGITTDAGAAAADDSTLTNTGNITSVDTSIFSRAGGNVVIDQTGNITSSTADGIDAVSASEDVTIAVKGDVTAAARGIVADAGGNANFDQSTLTSMGTIASGGDGIFSRAGNNVSVDHTGDIVSAGEDGIDASSSSRDVNVAFTGNITAAAQGINANAGNGNVDTTTVTSTGNITSGNTGINAVSQGAVSVDHTGNISAANGHGINADSAGRAATVTVDGDVAASGNNQHGILIDGGATEDLSVNVNGGIIAGGSGAGAGVQFNNTDSAALNQLTNKGTIGALSGLAVGGAGGSETVINTGVINGNIDLGAGNNALNNQAGGVINAGQVLNLGAGNVYTNSGNLSPGGSGTRQTTTITGNLVQPASGTLEVDVDAAQSQADRVNVTGTAELAGTVLVQLSNPTSLQQNLTILSATGGTTNNGLSLAPLGPLLEAELLFPNPTDVVLGITVDFTPDQDVLNPNQTNIAVHLNAALGAGGGAMDPVFADLLSLQSLAQYKQALDQLSPEVYLSSQTTSIFAAEEFTNNLFSCPSRGAGHLTLEEGQCIWIRPEGRYIDGSATKNQIGFDETVGSFSVGAQVALAENWFAGLGVSVETSRLETASGAISDGNRFQIGGVIKHQSGPFLLGAAITAGLADFDTQRSVNFGGFSATLNSNDNSHFVVAQTRAAYVHALGNFYIKPLVDFNLFHIDRDDIDEQGNEAARLQVSGSDATLFAATPAVEFGSEFDIGGVSRVRAFAKIGATFFDDSDISLSARFAGAPAGIGSFSISTEFDDVYADIETGLTLFSPTGGSSMSVLYEGRLSDTVEQHGVVLKGNVQY